MDGSWKSVNLYVFISNHLTAFHTDRVRKNLPNSGDVKRSRHWGLPFFLIKQWSDIWTAKCKNRFGTRWGKKEWLKNFEMRCGWKSNWTSLAMFRQKEGKSWSIPCSLDVFREQLDDSHKSPVQQRACEIGNTIEKNIFVNFVDQGSLNGRRKQGWSNSKKNFRFRWPFGKCQF